MNRIGKKIAWVSLSGMMIFSLPSCGKKDNAADETPIDPDYIIQEYETTTTDEGYTIINGFYRIKSNNGDKDTILYIPYIENKQQGVSYLEELHIKSSTERRIDLEAGNTPDGALYNKQTSSDYGAPYVEACIVPDFALPYYNANDTIPNWYLSDNARYVFTYRVEKAGDVKSTSDTMASLDIGAISVAMYEDFYDDIPKMNISVYGVPKSLYNKAYQKEADRLAALYKNRIEMSVVSLNKSDILSACTDGVTEGNIRAKKVGLYYTERKSSTVAPEIILAVNEELPYVMESGRIPGTSEEDYGKRLVALGRSQYRYAYEENGKHYVTFENETYEVTGIIGNEGSDYSDNMIVFDNRCLGDNVRKSVNELKEYTIMIDSNTTELNDTYEKVYNNVYGADINCAIESRSVSGNGQSTVEKTLQKENIKINKVVYIFCILNCMLMSEFWIIERNKEFAIKRTYGFGQLRLIGGIARDILILGVASLVIYVLVHLFAVGVLGIKLYTISWNLRLIASVLFINLTALVCTIIVPVYRIMKMNPAVTLEDME